MRFLSVGGITQVKMGSSRCGFKKVEMKVPKGWFLRMSKGPGPEQSLTAESG